MTTEEAMAETIEVTPDRFSQAGHLILRILLADCHPNNFAVRLWDGTTWGPEFV